MKHTFFRGTFFHFQIAFITKVDQSWLGKVILSTVIVTVWKLGGGSMYVSFLAGVTGIIAIEIEQGVRSRWSEAAFFDFADLIVGTVAAYIASVLVTVFMIM